MKTFRKSIVVFLLFFIGTASLVHVDRQCAQMTGRKTDALTEAAVWIRAQI